MTTTCSDDFLVPAFDYTQLAHHRSTFRTNDSDEWWVRCSCGWPTRDRRSGYWDAPYAAWPDEKSAVDAWVRHVDRIDAAKRWVDSQ